MNAIWTSAALMTFLAVSAPAQGLVGYWQASLNSGPFARYSFSLHVTKSTEGAWAPTLYIIDQQLDWRLVPKVELTGGSTLQFTDTSNGAVYSGKLSTDGQSITGTFTQGPSQELVFHHVRDAAAWRDNSPHTVQFVSPENKVKLEVLDWGGSGPPLILLSGLGNTAHIFDKFAPKLTSGHHVYGITRRGYGASSDSPSGYAADRLGDDVVAVIDALALDHPVLAGHSIAGEELSSVGSRHAEKISGLIYLDAGYGYAFDSRSDEKFKDSLSQLESQLEQLRTGKPSRQAREQLMDDLLENRLPALETELRERSKLIQAQTILETAQRRILPPLGPPMPSAGREITAGEQKYTDIRVPILAIYALPHSASTLLQSVLNQDSAVRAAYETIEEITVGGQAKAFEAELPSARVVRLPHANHYVFLSNEGDVLREMNAFTGGLKLSKN